MMDIYIWSMRVTKPNLSPHNTRNLQSFGDVLTRKWKTSHKKITNMVNKYPDTMSSDKGMLNTREILTSRRKLCKRRESILEGIEIFSIHVLSH